MRSLVLLFAAAFGVIAAREPRAAEPLAFALPDGFVDHTNDGAAELTPLLLSMGMATSRVVTVAVDNAAGKLRAGMIAAVVDGSADEVVLPSPSDLQHRMRMSAINQGVTLSRLEVERVTVAGVRALRMITESPGDSVDAHREVYFVPGETQLGVVICLVSPADAATYAPRFAAAINKTRGLHAVPWWRFSLAGIHGADIGKLAGLVFAIPFGYLAFAAKKERRRRERIRD